MDKQMLDRLGSLQAATHGNVVRVTVPVDVAFNLEQIQTVQSKVLEELGCRACCSGFDIRYDFAREFLVDRELNVKSSTLPQQ
jgi:hypothetical protein